MRQQIRAGVFLLGTIFLTTGLQGQADVDGLLEREINNLVSTYKHLHSHPELSYQEKATSELLAKELRALGFAVTENVGDYGVPGRISYGLVAVMKNGKGPTVMVRTDLDGLPVTENTGVPYASRVTVKAEAGETGAMHACAHDIHMTSFLGTAKLLTQLKDRWSGTLVMIGQPAEERGAGARAMLKGGLYEKFPKPDYALALHTSAALEAGKIGYRSEYALANVDSVDITIRGIGGHGAYPHKTKDPIVLAAEVVTALQTIVSREVNPLDPAVVTVGSIHGGTKHNIIPDEVHLQLTVRSYKPEVRKQLIAAIRRITLGVAAVNGIPAELAPTVTVPIEEYTPSTYNDPKLTARTVAALQSALGPENVVETEPVMAGEDFGRYALEDRSVPICILWLGGVDPKKVRAAEEKGLRLPPLHSSKFAPLPEPTVRTGVKGMTSIVLDLMKK